MKKIGIFILIFCVSLTFICTSIKVDAKDIQWTSTNVIASNTDEKQINDNLENGCFISIFDFLKTGSNIRDFFNLHFNKDYSFSIDVFIDGLTNSLYHDYFYVQDDHIECSFIYFKSESKLNNFLVNNRFINPGETYLDPIDGYSASEYTVTGKNPYTCLDALLNSDLNYEFIYPSSLPDSFYRRVNNPNLENGFFKIVDNFSYGVVNGKWCYRNLSIDVEGELSKVDINNAIGKFKKIASDKYEYSYLQQKYSPEFGYYTYQSTDYETMILTKNQMPVIAFDSNGNLKDNYFSIYDNYWRIAYVNKVNKVLISHYVIKHEFYYTSYRGSSDSGDDFYLFVAYLNFDVPVDSIEKIVLKYKYWNVNQKFNPLKKWGWIDYKIYNATCTVYRDTKVVNPFYKKGTNGQYSYDKAITKGNYQFNINEKSYNYDFRICLSDDDFVPKSYAEKDYYTSYPLHEQPLNELEVVEMYYTYQAILYNADKIITIPDEGNNNPNNRECWLWKLIKKIWNSGLFGKVILIVSFILILLPIIYLLSILFKWVKKLKKNKSPK